MAVHRPQRDNPAKLLLILPCEFSVLARTHATASFVRAEPSFDQAVTEL